MDTIDLAEERFKRGYEKEGLNSPTAALFHELIYEYYGRHGRDFPWRRTPDPYHILVSEVMLQQTQTGRVIPKYEEFTRIFPDFRSLAAASVREVLEVWKGLGYNRRALSLLSCAQMVEKTFGGILPDSPAVLLTFPGIGKYTASAIAAFAFQQPVVFVETNIRAVFLHHFFPGQEGVTDSSILPVIEKTLDREHPKEWYYALMDYGAALKASADPGRRSAAYRKQSPFKGSNRELRSMILSSLMEGMPLTADGVIERTGRDAVPVRRNLSRLEEEGFIRKDGEFYIIPSV